MSQVNNIPAGDLVFDKDLIARYDRAGPRYTSYPTAVQFQALFDSGSYIENARASNENLIPQSLSLYFHLPFCSTVCYYCACSKIITRNRDHAAPYLALLHREIELQADLFDGDRIVEQLHWGGGTPTFINRDQMTGLMEYTRALFTLREDDHGEYSIELDPRECDADLVSHLRGLGFNRISLGVQDFDPEVQRAVNRIQSLEETREVIEAAREAGFRSVSLDLIYGLPRQSSGSFQRTLEKIIALEPDRLSIFNYAHMPDRFKVQKQINEAELPDPATKLEIFRNNIRMLTSAGYVNIGMDHFARPGDELTLAQQRGELTRNFQGYSTHGGLDLLAFGPSAISQVGDAFAQNERKVIDWQIAVREARLPIARGLKRSADDHLRAEIISTIMCSGGLDYCSFERDWQFSFPAYFATELERLKPLADDGLMIWTEHGFESTAEGLLFLRAIAMAFDAHLQRDNQHSSPRFSRIV